MTVGRIVAGSRGIRLSSIEVPCSSFCSKESRKKYYVDVIRAITWVTTGKDLKRLIPENVGVSFTD